MKTLVFVLVPYDVAVDDIDEYCHLLLQSHRIREDGNCFRGHYDYLVGALDQCFNDDATECRLPPRVRRSYAGNICEVTRLPKDADCGALVTPDGRWHDLSDFGWRMVQELNDENKAAVQAWKQHYQAMIAANPNCWVIAIWAHS